MEFVDLIAIPRVDNVVLTDKTIDKSKDWKIEGTLCISGHHLILSDRQKSDQQELWVSKKLVLNLNLILIYLFNISSASSLFLFDTIFYEHLFSVLISDKNFF